MNKLRAFLKSGDQYCKYYWMDINEHLVKGWFAPDDFNVFFEYQEDPKYVIKNIGFSYFDKGDLHYTIVYKNPHTKNIIEKRIYPKTVGIKGTPSVPRSPSPFVDILFPTQIPILFKDFATHKTSFPFKSVSFDNLEKGQKTLRNGRSIIENSQNDLVINLNSYKNKIICFSGIIYSNHYMVGEPQYSECSFVKKVTNKFFTVELRATIFTSENFDKAGTKVVIPYS